MYSFKSLLLQNRTYFMVFRVTNIEHVGIDPKGICKHAQQIKAMVEKIR